MGQISIRLPDDDERDLRKRASEMGMNLAEFCRAQLIDADEKTNPAIIEKHLDAIEAQLRELRNVQIKMLHQHAKNCWKLERIFYYLMKFAVNKETADKIFQNVEQEADALLQKGG